MMRFYNNNNKPLLLPPKTTILRMIKIPQQAGMRSTMNSTHLMTWTTALEAPTMAFLDHVCTVGWTGYRNRVAEEAAVVAEESLCRYNHAAAMTMTLRTIISTTDIMNSTA